MIKSTRLDYVSKTGVGLLIALATVLFFAGSAAAHHFDYRAEDSNLQSTAQFGVENHNFRWWALSNSNLRWYAPTSIRSDVDSAVSNWESVIPDLDWFGSTSSASTADLEFEYKSCAGGGAGRFTVDTWYDDSTRDANYWTDARICVSNTTSYGTNGRLAVIAHEMGHAYGLHEQYLDQQTPSACNNAVVSIMDTGTGSPLVHCDSLTGPALHDENNVDAYWSLGQMEAITHSYSAPNVKIQWEDGAWAEQQWNMEFWYHNGTNWIMYGTGTATADIGTHRDMPVPSVARVLEFSGARHGTGEWHSICGTPYFVKYNVTGTGRCSEVFWVP